MMGMIPDSIVYADKVAESKAVVTVSDTLTDFMYTYTKNKKDLEAQEQVNCQTKTEKQRYLSQIGMYG